MHKQPINVRVGGLVVKSKYSETLKRGLKKILMYGSGQIRDKSSLKPVRRFTLAFSSGLDTPVSPEIVKALPTGIKDCDFLFEGLNTRFNRYNSFKESNLVDLAEELMNPE